MRLQPIFARSSDPTDGGVFAIIYDENGQNAWVELINRLNDVSYLHEFFNDRRHLSPLRGSGDAGIERAVSHARAEVADLVNYIRQLAQQKPNDDTYASLGQLFKPLENWRVDADVDLLKEKARGRKHNKWLRIYAIRVRPNLYIITGGALKMVHQMQDDAVTCKELVKLKRVKDWLKGLGIVDAESFEGL